MPNVINDHHLHELTMYNDNKNASLYQEDLVRCYAVEAPENTIALRVNNTLSLYVINQKVRSVYFSFRCIFTIVQDFFKCVFYVM